MQKPMKTQKRYLQGLEKSPCFIIAGPGPCPCVADMKQGMAVSNN